MTWVAFVGTMVCAVPLAVQIVFDARVERRRRERIEEWRNSP